MNANNAALPESERLGLLLFRSAGRVFALPDAAVLEIVPAGTVTPLPFTPPWVEGLANIAGRILPQARFAALLAVEEEATSAGERIIVRTPTADCVLAVAVVLARIEIDCADLNPFAPGDTADSAHSANTDRVDEASHAPDTSHTPDTSSAPETKIAAAVYVCAELTYEGQSVLLLDVARLGALFSEQEPVSGQPGLLGAPGSAVLDVVDEQLGCLCFRAGGERYAMALADVGEIIEVAALTPLPGAPEGVAGLSTLRGEPLLMVSLAQWLGLPADAEPAALVLEHDGLRIGLLVSAVDGMAGFAPAALRPLGAGAGLLAGVLHRADGRVLGLLTATRLLMSERSTRLVPWVPTRARQQHEREREYRPHLMVQIGGDTFGLPLPMVQRILPWRAPEVVDAGEGREAGVVSLEGDVVPVLDPERLRVGVLAATPAAWVVLGDAVRPWALAVDVADAIVQVPVDTLEMLGNGQGNTHGSGQGGRQGVIEAVAHVDGRLLAIVSASALAAGPT
ncbi:MAG: chemotaxis protein CheW [Moraxellaceae bacterium]|nr:chemotaxis protein CheW [Moraxellaceae bacterium]